MRKSVLGLAVILAALISATRFVSSGSVVGNRSVPVNATANAGTPTLRPDSAALADTESVAYYARTCSACHGMPDEPGHTLGTRLFDPAYGATREDSTIARIITQGVPGSTMTGFGPQHANLLSADQVDAMVRWIRTTSGRSQ